MIADLRCSGAAVALALIMGCGTTPPEVNESSDSVNELRKEVRENEERQQQAINKLQDELTNLKNSLKLLEQLQILQAAQTETQLRELGVKLDKATEHFNKLPVDFKLQMRFPRRIEGTLEEAVAELSHWTRIPIRFEIGDLGEAGIPKIHQVELAGEVPVGKLLGEALCQTNLYRVSSLADPQLNVVYVIQNAGDLGNESLLITSRKRAAQRGKLPDEFVIKKVVKK